jgi:ABC-type Fe3+ transport system substrate-binding protein
VPLRSGLSLASCGSRLLAAILAAAFVQVGAAKALTSDEILKLGGPERQQILIDGAKKEGEVVFYSSLIVDKPLRPLVEAFMKKYPFIKATYWRGDTEGIVAKLIAEERSGHPVVDVMEGAGIGAAANTTGFLASYKTPVLDSYPPDYRDPQGIWAPTRLSYFALGYNTKLVSPADVPKTYDDLLDPRWQGKMAWRVGDATGAAFFLTNLRLAWGEDKAMDYFKKLAQQRIINFAAGSARTLVDRVIAGEYPIALGIFAHHPLSSKNKGASVDSQLLAPVASTAGTLAVAKDLPHPYSAMLLVDFILSEEGQTVLAQAGFFPANPRVPPLPWLIPVVPRNAHVPENFIGPQKAEEYASRSQKIFDTLFR